MVKSYLVKKYMHFSKATLRGEASSIKADHQMSSKKIKKNACKLRPGEGEGEGAHIDGAYVEPILAANY